MHLTILKQALFKIIYYEKAMASMLLIDFFALMLGKVQIVDLNFRQNFP